MFSKSYRLLLLVKLEFLTRKRWRQLGTLLHGIEFRLHIQRLGSGGGQFDRALLQGRHNLRMLFGNVVFLGRVLRDVGVLPTVVSPGAIWAQVEPGLESEALLANCALP